MLNQYRFQSSFIQVSLLHTGEYITFLVLFFYTYSLNLTRIFMFISEFLSCCLIFKYIAGKKFEKKTFAFFDFVSLILFTEPISVPCGI